MEMLFFVCGGLIGVCLLRAVVSWSMRDMKTLFVVVWGDGMVRFFFFAGQAKKVCGC